MLMKTDFKDNSVTHTQRTEPKTVSQQFMAILNRVLKAFFR